MIITRKEEQKIRQELTHIKGILKYHRHVRETFYKNGCKTLRRFMRDGFNFHDDDILEFEDAFNNVIIKDLRKAGS